MPNEPQEFLPLTPEEVAARGWDAVDVVLVTGDAYADHPSFGAALVGRVLEAAGFRVALLAQPDWRSCEEFRRFERPRLFFGVTAGSLDSMAANRTASGKPRRRDAYSPGGRGGRRPDRASIVYAQRAREAFPGVPIVLGGVEASLRRLAHYDCWQDKVRGSILLDAKADLLVYGMGEAAILEIARRLAEGEGAPRDVRGTVYAAGARETPPPEALRLPALEEVRADAGAFMSADRLIHDQWDPRSARPLAQAHGERWAVQNPPAPPLSAAELDRIYELPFTRRAHPAYKEPIPALETVRHSITILRGCPGGCAFCSLAAHQGRLVQSRSAGSVLVEIGRLAGMKGFKGTVSDLGGPTANVYGMECRRDPAKGPCRRRSCLQPKICENFHADFGPLLGLMRRARKAPGVKRALVASGVRMDLALLEPRYIEELAAHHTGGHLKVAPEHADPGVLKLMRKPPAEVFEKFAELFERASRKAGKEQYLLPYFMSGHPGADRDAAVKLALYMKERGLRPRQGQEFTPLPMEESTALFHTGLDPSGRRPVRVPRREKERAEQRVLLHFFLKEHWPEVRRILREWGREDLIGRGAGRLVPPEGGGGKDTGRKS